MNKIPSFKIYSSNKVAPIATTPISQSLPRAIDIFEIPFLEMEANNFHQNYRYFTFLSDDQSAGIHPSSMEYQYATLENNLEL